MKFNYIELFAGCGGLSLGLKSAGFEFFMGNELSPMAAETFAYNLLNENLRESSIKDTLWIKSNYALGDIRRLSEDPLKFKSGCYSDINNNTILKGKLLVGDVYDIINVINHYPKLKHELRSANIDLISGGPPCQSFSLAGRREKDNHRNTLPLAFANFVEIVQPKLVLLENVSGILRAFKDAGVKYYAWYEVAKAFALKGYVPISIHINAKYYGPPQNRPRFILLGIRKDLVKLLKNNKDDILLKSINFYKRVLDTKGNIKIDEINYNYWDLENIQVQKYFANSVFLPKPNYGAENNYRSVSYAIDNIKKMENEFNTESIKHDKYHAELEKSFKNESILNSNSYVVYNHNLRKHTEKITNRFKLFKIIQNLKNGEKLILMNSIKTGKVGYISDSTINLIRESFPEVTSLDKLEIFIKRYTSKKHSQRPLIKDQPAPAALSIPDDVCHYDPNRTLSVREMARIQSFPDWFHFRAKDTTGGLNRRFEVPNYTQVGNAVPPLLGKELGIWMISLLKKLKG